LPQVVGILSLLAALLHIPESVMGLTLMAWGNSLGDLAGNPALALNGLPAMALTACIASECGRRRARKEGGRRGSGVAL
jgi:sodium/potassium/calcium exchanger 6